MYCPCFFVGVRDSGEKIDSKNETEIRGKKMVHGHGNHFSVLSFFWAWASLKARLVSLRRNFLNSIISPENLSATPSWTCHTSSHVHCKKWLSWLTMRIP